MEIELIRLVQLLDAVAVICLLAYLFTRTRYAVYFIEKTVTVRSILIFSFVGGLLYLYGIFTGFEIGQFFISIQILGPVIAGIVAGPVSGVLAGCIGLALQYLVGYGYYESEILVVLISGFVGGVFWYITKGRLIKIIHVFFLGSLIGLIQLIGGIRGVHPDLLDSRELLEAGVDLFLPTIAGLCLFMFIINNLKLDEEKKRKAFEIEGQLRAARKIQMDSLPPHRWEGPSYSLAASLIPASYVGGDLYDYLELDDDTLYFALGDVSGKGVPAALVMSSTRMVLRSKVREVRDPCALVQEVNRSLIEDGDNEQFITLIVGILNLKTGVVRLCNAGHPPPVLIRSTEIIVKQSGQNLPAGVLKEEIYNSYEIAMGQGEVLVMISDGVTEAEHQGEWYGQERFEEVLDRERPDLPEDVISLLIHEVREWTGNNPLSDDCTVLAIGYRSEENEREIW